MLETMSSKNTQGNDMLYLLEATPGLRTRTGFNLTLQSLDCLCEARALLGLSILICKTGAQVGAASWERVSAPQRHVIPCHSSTVNLMKRPVADMLFPSFSDT